MKALSCITYSALAALILLGGLGKAQASALDMVCENNLIRQQKQKEMLLEGLENCADGTGYYTCDDIRKDLENLSQKNGWVTIFEYPRNAQNFDSVFYDCNKKSLQAETKVGTTSLKLEKKPAKMWFNEGSKQVAIEFGAVRYELKLLLGEVAMLKNDSEVEVEADMEEYVKPVDKWFVVDDDQAQLDGHMVGVVREDTPINLKIKSYGQKVGFGYDRRSAIHEGQVLVNGKNVSESEEEYFYASGGFAAEIWFPAEVSTDTDSLMDPSIAFELQLDPIDILKNLSRSSQ